MLAYKAFSKGAVCRGYKFNKTEWNKTTNANCAKNGFHCCENPIDCFNYYSEDSTSNHNEYYLVECGGDIHEDGTDTRISCTEMRLIRQLSLFEMIVETVKFIRAHPYRECSRRINKEEQYDATKNNNVINIVRGKNPRIKGLKNQILAIIKEDENSFDISAAAVFEIDNNFKGNTWYEIKDSNIVEVEDE